MDDKTLAKYRKFVVPQIPSFKDDPELEYKPTSFRLRKRDLDLIDEATRAVGAENRQEFLEGILVSTAQYILANFKPRPRPGRTGDGRP